MGSLDCHWYKIQFIFTLTLHCNANRASLAKGHGDSPDIGLIPLDSCGRSGRAGDDMLVAEAERHESIVVWIQMASRSVGIRFVFPFAAKEIGIGLGDTHTQLQCRENTFNFGGLRNFRTAEHLVLHRQVQSKACGPCLGNSGNADTSPFSSERSGVESHYNRVVEKVVQFPDGVQVAL